MFFQLDDYTLTVTQMLELLDKNRLDRDGLRALAEAQKSRRRNHVRTQPSPRIRTSGIPASGLG